jgi:hypothetical protein
MCPGVPEARRVLFRCLASAVMVSAAVSPGWAMPRYGRPGTYGVDGSPIGVAAAAIDAQSGRDLVTANEAGEAGPSLSILSNRGAGSFFAEQRVSLGTATDILHAFAVADFNGDGRGDVAVAVDDASTVPVRAAVLVYLNTGSGFATPVRYPLSGSFPRCLAAADVNGDGALDLVVCHATATGGNATGLVTVLAGQRTGTTPNGTFQQAYSGTVGTAPAALAVGDVDSDGHADLVVIDATEQRVLILYGRAGAPLFESPAELAPVDQPVAALVNDAPDLPLPQVLIASTTGGRLLSFRQTEARAFAPPVEQSIAFVPQAIALGDADRDGIDDLFVASALGVELWYGRSDGSFQFGESLSRDNALDALTIADLNGDQLPDVAASASTQDRVTVILNGADVPSTPSPTPTVTATGTRTATPTRTIPISPSRTPTRTPGGSCAGDCNGDGTVTINELIQGVNIALGNAGVATCTAFDRDGNGQITINELIAGVNSAQHGCAA